MAMKFAANMKVRAKEKVRALKIRNGGEEGSVAVLTIGLFLVTVALLALITNVAAIAVAKRSLVHATEAAALSGSHNLDLRTYYRQGATRGVPIDCQAARWQISEEINSWMRSDSDLRRPELQKIWITEFRCSGSLLELSTSAIATLPFRLPQSTLTDVEIHASASVRSERKN